MGSESRIEIWFWSEFSLWRLVDCLFRLSFFQLYDTVSRDSVAGSLQRAPSIPAKMHQIITASA